MATDMHPEELARIIRVIKAHGGEIVSNPQGDGKQVIIDLDDLVNIIRLGDHVRERR